MAHFVRDADHRWRQGDTAVSLLHAEWNVCGDAAKLLQKVNVKVGAAELAVGNAFEPDVLLEFHNFGDGFVFDQAQLLGRYGSCGFLGTGIKQVFGTQKTADMVVVSG